MSPHFGRSPQWQVAPALWQTGTVCSIVKLRLRALCCSTCGIVYAILTSQYCDAHLGIGPRFSATLPARAQHMQISVCSGSGEAAADPAQLWRIWKFCNRRLLGWYKREPAGSFASLPIETLAKLNSVYCLLTSISQNPSPDGGYCIWSFWYVITTYF